MLAVGCFYQKLNCFSMHIFVAFEPDQLQPIAIFESVTESGCNAATWESHQSNALKLSDGGCVSLLLKPKL